MADTQNPPAAQENDPGPSENEMPDAEGIQKRVQSGEERSSAQDAFGGTSDGDVPAEAAKTS